MKLNEMKAGEKAIISAIADEFIDVCKMGLIIGEEIECVSKFGGSVLIDIHNSKIMIGGETADQIIVVRS